MAKRYQFILVQKKLFKRNNNINTSEKWRYRFANHQQRLRDLLRFRNVCELSKLQRNPNPMEKGLIVGGGRIISIESRIEFG